MSPFADSRPRPLPAPSFAFWAWGLPALWLLALVAGPALLSTAGLSLNPHGHVHLHAHGHPFVDARTFWGIPHALDVLSNAPLALAGLLGLWRLRARELPGATRAALTMFFAGLLLTSGCSATYHWAPDAGGLVADRLGMALTFAGALALAVAERVGPAPSRAMLVAASFVAVLSAVLPYTHGHVLPWAVVQFGGLAFIAWTALQKPVAGALGLRIGWLIALYALAKLLEMGDAAVFQATGEWVSGHSLKHIVAALAAGPVLACLATRRLRENGPDNRTRPV